MENLEAGREGFWGNGEPRRGVPVGAEGGGAAAQCGLLKKVVAFILRSDAGGVRRQACDCPGSAGSGVRVCMRVYVVGKRA